MEGNTLIDCTLVPPSHGGSTWNLALIGQAVLEKIFEKMVDGRTTEHGYTFSSPREPDDSGR